MENKLVVGKLVTKLVADASQYNSEMQRAQNRAEKWRTAVAGAFLGVSAAASAYLTRATMTAARTQVLGTSLKVVGEQAGYSRAELKAYEAAIKRMGITTQNARLAMIRFIQANLDLADAAKLARAAQDLAVIAGMNSSEAFERITQAINGQIPRLLRVFGIVQNLDEIYTNFGRTLGIYTETINSAGEAEGHWARQLTETEKKQALLNAVLEQAAKVSGTYVAAMGDVGKKMTSLPRVFEEARNAIGKHYLPVLNALVTATYNSVKWFDKQSEATQKMVAYFIGLTAAVTAVAGAGLLLAPVLGTIASAVAAIGAPVAAVIAATGALAAAWSKNVGNIQGKTRGLLRTFRAVSEYTRRELAPGVKAAWGELTGAVGKGVDYATRKLHEWGLTHEWLQGVVSKATSMMIDALALMLDRVMDVGRGMVAAFSAAMKAMKGDFGAAKEILKDAWREIEKSTAESTRAQVAAIYEDIRAVEDLSNQDEKLVRLAEAWKRAGNDVVASAGEMAEAALSVNDAWQKILESIQAIGQSAADSVRDTFARIRDEYAQHAVNIVRIEYERRRALEQLEREYQAERYRLEKSGHVAALKLLQEAVERKRAGILAYYSQRIKDERKAQETLLVTARQYLQAGLDEVNAMLTARVRAFQVAWAQMQRISLANVTSIIAYMKAARQVMEAGQAVVDIQRIRQELLASFDAIRRDAENAANDAANQWEAWRDANLNLRQSIEDLTGSFDEAPKKTKEKLRDPLLEAAEAADKLATATQRVQDALNELALSGAVRGDWLTPMREAMDAAIVMLREWAIRVKELLGSGEAMLAGEDREKFVGVLQAVNAVMQAVAATARTVEMLAEGDIRSSAPAFDIVADWARQAVEAMGALVDLDETVNTPEFQRALIVGTVAKVLSDVGNAARALAELDAVPRDVTEGLSVVERAAAAMVEAMRRVAASTGMIGRYEETFAKRLQSFLSPIRDVRAVVEGLADIRYLRGTDLGGTIEWGVELLAQVAVWMGRLRARLPDAYVPENDVARFAASMRAIIAPLKDTAAVIDALNGIRHLRGTDLGHAIGWGDELLAQVAVWFGRLRRRLPEAYIPDRDAERLAGSLQAITGPLKSVADMVRALDDIRHLRGTDLGHVIEWGVELLAQTAVWFGRLRRRLPEAHVPTAAWNDMAANIESIIKPLRAIAGAVGSLADIRYLRGTDLGGVIEWGVELLAQTAVWFGRLRQRLPEAHVPTAAWNDMAANIESILRPLRTIADVVSSLADIRYLRGTGLGDVIGWGVELLAQVMVRIRRLNELDVSGVRRAAGVTSAVGGIVDVLERVVALAGQMADVAHLRGRLDAGGIIEWVTGLIGDIATGIENLPDGWADRLQQNAGAFAAAQTAIEAIGRGIDVLGAAANVRYIDRAKANLNAMVNVWDNILTSLDAKISSGEFKINRLVEKWGNSVSALADSLSAGIRVIREARAIRDVDTLVPLAQNLGERIIEFLNALAEKVSGFDAEKDNVLHEWGEAVEALMGGLAAGIEVIRSRPRTWQEPGAVWDSFVEWVKDTYRTFHEWVNGPNGFEDIEIDLTAEWAAALESLMNGLQTALGLAANLPLAWDVRADVWDAFKAWVKATFKDFHDWVTEPKTGLDAEGIALVQAFGDAMNALFTGLRSGLDVFENLVGLIPPADERITWFQDHVKSMFTSFHDEAERLGSDATEATGAYGRALQDLVGGLSSALELFTTLMDQNLRRFIGTGNEKDGELARALSDLIQGISTTMSAFQTWVVNKFDTSWGPAADTLREKVEAVVGTLKSALELFTSLQEHGLPSTDLIQKFIDSVMNLFQVFADNLGDSSAEVDEAGRGVTEALGRTAQHIGAQQADFVRAGQQIALALAGGMTDEETVNWAWEGRVIMLGLKAGLDQGRGDVIAAMRETAERMREELERAWGIASPSKVAERIGRHITDGLVRGLGPAQSILSGGRIEVENRRRIDVRVTVDGSSMGLEERMQLARELAYLIRAGV